MTMKNESTASGGKETLNNGDAQMPTHNSNKNLNITGGSNSNPSAAIERGYNDGSKFGGGGKDNFKIRQQNPNDY
jgi:hypothetical protein